MKPKRVSAMGLLVGSPPSRARDVVDDGYARIDVRELHRVRDGVRVGGIGHSIGGGEAYAGVGRLDGEEGSGWDIALAAIIVQQRRYEIGAFPHHEAFDLR